MSRNTSLVSLVAVRLPLAVVESGERVQLGNLHEVPVIATMVFFVRMSELRSGTNESLLGACLVNTHFESSNSSLSV